MSVDTAIRSDGGFGSILLNSGGSKRVFCELSGVFGDKVFDYEAQFCDMTSQEHRNSGIKTVDRVFDVIETLRENGTLGVTEVADELAVANSTAHAHLASLRERGYVVREDEGYRLSMRFLDLGNQVRRQWKINEKAAKPLKSLADNSNEVAWLMVEEKGYAVHVQKAIGRAGIQSHGWIGRHAHMHHLAGGKAIMAWLPDPKVEEIIDKHGLPEMTENTITDRETLLSELEKIRAKGYAFNNEETYQGLRCLGAPVVSHGEGVVGAVSICGPTRRFSESRIENELTDQLLESVNEIELQLSQG